MIIPYRGDAYFTRELKLAGDLGQVLFQPYHLQDEESIRKAVKYSNVVINLVGRDWETKNFKFKDVHVEGARRIARISREMGVERLIHLSALNIDPLPAVSYIVYKPLRILSKLSQNQYNYNISIVTTFIIIFAFFLYL